MKANDEGCEMVMAAAVAAVAVAMALWSVASLSPPPTFAFLRSANPSVRPYANRNVFLSLSCRYVRGEEA